MKKEKKNPFFSSLFLRLSSPYFRFRFFFRTSSFSLGLFPRSRLFPFPSLLSRELGKEDVGKGGEFYLGEENRPVTLASFFCWATGRVTFANFQKVKSETVVGPFMYLFLCVQYFRS